METIERLRAIANGAPVNEESKKLIRELSKQYELPFEEKSRCKSCWIDQSILLLLEMRGEIPAEERPKARLREDIDVIINGVRINNGTLTDDLIDKYRGKGLPEHWFV